MTRPGKIISGGQSGADRAALDFAIAKKIPHGGWCPLGRIAEDGVIDAKYELHETPTAIYEQRTEWNVRDSDGTVIFTIRPEFFGGSAATVDFAKQHGKPWLHLSETRDGATAAEKLRRFVEQNRINVLNVAGTRESNEPAIGGFVRRTLRAWWQARCNYTVE
jgi:hypothetical protein